MNVTLMKAGVVGDNGYMYTQEVLESIADSMNGELVLVALSEDKTATLNLMDVAANVTKLWIEGDELKATIDVLETRKGVILKDILHDVVFRPRGEGLLEDGVVQLDYKLICVDAILKGKESITL